jgi:predicted HicB family RNase H-like nuclease
MTLRGVTKGQEPRDYRLTIRIPTSLHAAIKRTALEDKRSVSDWIVVTLQGVIAEREARAQREKERPKRK